MTLAIDSFLDHVNFIRPGGLAIHSQHDKAIGHQAAIVLILARPCIML